MLKFIVCEDNEEDLTSAVQTITKAMMNYDIEYKILKFYRHNKELEAVINEPFDTKIYLLDIEIPVVGGLEIASEIREIDDKSYIIFVTSHPECKNDIFFSRLEAIDYISKQYRYQERVEETIKYIVDRMLRNKVLTFTYNHTTYKVLYKNITYIEKDPSGAKSIIHFINDKPKYTNRTITSFEKEMSPLFYRSHKACLVNLENISKVEYADFTIYFKNGDSTNLLSTACRKGLRERVGSFEDIFE